MAKISNKSNQKKAPEAETKVVTPAVEPTEPTKLTGEGDMLKNDENLNTTVEQTEKAKFEAQKAKEEETNGEATGKVLPPLDNDGNPIVGPETNGPETNGPENEPTTETEDEEVDQLLPTKRKRH